MHARVCTCESVSVCVHAHMCVCACAYLCVCTYVCVSGLCLCFYVCAWVNQITLFASYETKKNLSYFSRIKRVIRIHFLFLQSIDRNILKHTHIYLQVIISQKSSREYLRQPHYSSVSNLCSTLTTQYVIHPSLTCYSHVICECWAVLVLVLF